MAARVIFFLFHAITQRGDLNLELQLSNQSVEPAQRQRLSTTEARSNEAITLLLAPVGTN